MAPIPRIQPSTVRAIYESYEAEAESWDSLGISVGSANDACDRSIWYDFRWALPVERPRGQMLRLFQTGNIEEDRLVADLGRIGVEVYGQQDRIRLVSGHVRGKADGKGIGILEAPKTEHLLEFKSSNKAGFREIQKKGCKEAKPLHYGQCQLGMHAFGLTRCLYLVVNKNDDELYSERIEYDIEFTLRLLARLERIINSSTPPPRISDNPEFFGCMFCRKKDVCHHDEWPRSTCRSCIHATPEMTGDGHWSCARFSKPISFDEQKASCPAHLTIPQMVPGEMLSVDEAAETISYKLADGTLFVDGATQEEAA